MHARGCTGNSPGDLVLAIRKAWSLARPLRRVQSACAKLRQVPPIGPPSRAILLCFLLLLLVVLLHFLVLVLIHQVLPNRSFFFSRYFVPRSPHPLPPDHPSPVPSRCAHRSSLHSGFPLSARGRGAAPRCSLPSSLATQTSINFAGSGPTVFQFRVSTLNASALDRDGGRGWAREGRST